MVGDGDRRADRAGDAEPARDPRGGRQRRSTGSSRRRSSCRASTTSRHERGLRAARRRQPPARSTVEVAEAAVGRARRDRGDCAPLTSRMAPCGTRSPTTCTRSASTPTSSAAPCATSCSGPVREPTSSSPGSATPSCARRSSRTAASRTSSSPASGSASGCCRATGRRARSQPAGIEFAPPRVERSTGPGRHDFEIVADAGISLEEDMRAARLHDQRDRAAARDRRGPRPARRPRRPRARASCARRARRASATTRCGSCAACASSRSSASSRTRTRCARCASGRRGSSTSRASGSAAGSRRTGWASCRSSCSARSPAKALRLARDTGVLVHLLPEFEPAIGFDQESRCHDLPLDEHVFARRPGGRRRGRAARVRLAALLHDLGKPASPGAGATGGCTSTRRRGKRSRRVGADASRRSRACAIRRRLRATSVRIVREHMFDPKAEPDGRCDARRFLARHGERLALDLLAHSAPTWPGRTSPRRASGIALERFRDARRAGARAAAPARRPRGRRHRPDRGRLPPGPELGGALETLLAEVVDDPA